LETVVERVEERIGVELLGVGLGLCKMATGGVVDECESEPLDSNKSDSRFLETAKGREGAVCFTTGAGR